MGLLLTERAHRLTRANPLDVAPERRMRTQRQHGVGYRPAGSVPSFGVVDGPGDTTQPPDRSRELHAGYVIPIAAIRVGLAGVLVTEQGLA